MRLGMKWVFIFIFLALPVYSSANSHIKGSGQVNVITNSFPVLEVLGKAMEDCSTDTLKVTVKLTTGAKEEIPQAFSAAVTPYDMAAVANSTITPIQADGLIQPLNDLVDKYRDKYNIEDGMLIKFGKDVMAVAFMVNAQHL